MMAELRELRHIAEGTILRDLDVSKSLKDQVLSKTIDRNNLPVGQGKAHTRLSWSNKSKKIRLFAMSVFSTLAATCVVAALLFSIAGTSKSIARSTGSDTRAVATSAATKSQAMKYSYVVQSYSGLNHVRFFLSTDFGLTVQGVYLGRGMTKITLKMIPGKVVHLNPPNGVTTVTIPGSKPNQSVKKVTIDLTWCWFGDTKVNHGEIVFVPKKDS